MSGAAAGDTDAGSGGMAATAIQSDQMRASKVIGSTVYDSQGAKIGDIKDLILDHDGQVANVILDVGAFLGMGGKYVAVSMKDLTLNKDHLTLDRTKAELKAAPAYKLERPGDETGSASRPAGHMGAVGAGSTTAPAGGTMGAAPAPAAPAHQ
jgi:sporulation protein YlmC with PRC-barrel domain